MPEYDDEFGEPLPHNSHSIARDIAEANGFGHLWESYHPVVKQTLEWLDKEGYLSIVAPAAVGEGEQ
jgi:hypothetical protein